MRHLPLVMAFFTLLTVGTYEAVRNFLNHSYQRSNVTSFDSPCYETRRDGG